MPLRVRLTKLFLRESARRRVIIGHHLILHGYGHWMPNDPGGSGSDAVRQHKLADLGPMHFGRKRVHPPRDELRTFHKRAVPRLEFPRIWFDAAKRQAVGDAIGEIVATRCYTLWACAVLKNHVHICIRRHRDDALAMWRELAAATCKALRLFADVGGEHPVWSNRPYKVFLDSPDAVRSRVRYIKDNPAKEGLQPQRWPFVKTYDGWPECKRKASIKHP